MIGTGVQNSERVGDSQIEYLHYLYMFMFSLSQLKGFREREVGVEACVFLGAQLIN